MTWRPHDLDNTSAEIQTLAIPGVAGDAPSRDCLFTACHFGGQWSTHVVFVESLSRIRAERLSTP